LLLTACGRRISPAAHVYLAPTESGQRVYEVRCKDSVEKITATADLEEFTRLVTKTTATVWVHTSRYAELDFSWLHGLYFDGKIIVFVGPDAGQYLARVMDPTGKTKPLGGPEENLAAGRRFSERRTGSYSTTIVGDDPTAGLCAVLGSLRSDN